MIKVGLANRNGNVRRSTRLTARSGYQPQFSWSYLQPKYWLIWLGIFGLILLAFVPFRLRDKLASYIGKIVARKAKKQRHRAKINLQYCFPHWTEAQREQTIEEMFVIVTQVMLGIGKLRYARNDIYNAVVVSPG